MKGFIKLIICFAGILLISAFLAPVLFDFLPFKFERIFNRLVMIFTLAAVVFFVRIKKETLIAYGIVWSPSNLRLFLKTFFVSFFFLAGVTFLMVSFEQAVWAPGNPGVLAWSLEFAKCLLAALVIGFIEEFFFRGFIYRTLKDRLHWPVALSVIGTSLFYSALHFVDSDKPLIGPDPTFFDGLLLIAAPFRSVLHWESLWPAFVGLVVFGIILNLTVIWTRSLYAAIGVHAGCVFFIKLDGLFVDFLDKHPLWFGTDKIYDGMIGWIFLSLLGIILYFITKERENLKSQIGI